MIEALMRKGHAYRAADGSVYFKLSSFPDYGVLLRYTSATRWQTLCGRRSRTAASVEAALYATTTMPMRSCCVGLRLVATPPMISPCRQCLASDNPTGWGPPDARDSLSSVGALQDR